MKWILEKVKKVLIQIAKSYIQAGKYVGKVALGSLTLGVVIVPLVYLTSLLMQLFGVDTNINPTKVYPIDPSDTLMLVSVTLMIGIVEETLYRYLMMDCLMEQFMKLPSKVALIVSSVLFGSMHIFNTPQNLWLSVPQALGAIGGGLLLSLMYKRFGLHYVIMVHALYDFLAFKLLM